MLKENGGMKYIVLVIIDVFEVNYSISLIRVV